jgi:hypothetical protein
MEKILDENGDEFIFKNGEWFWVDLDDDPNGPFPSKEEARADAYANYWLDATFTLVTEGIGPARAAGLNPRPYYRKSCWSAIPFNCGDRVYAKVDPRHVGAVCAIISDIVRVRFDDGMKCDFKPGEIEKA